MASPSYHPVGNTIAAPRGDLLDRVDHPTGRGPRKSNNLAPRVNQVRVEAAFPFPLPIRVPTGRVVVTAPG
jgi:hypothetical protein